MKQGQVRIIGGQWRGRKLAVPEVKDLRPTPDRVRETLFNWLMPYIADANCLDLFAGTGVLGFEALSRGAKSATMVDQAPSVIRALEAAAETLQADGATMYAANVPAQLRKPETTFDIVFVDPPYQANLLIPTCHFLETQQFLSETAYIYLEAKHQIEDNDLPQHWRIIKSKQAGQVAYHLALREQ